MIQLWGTTGELGPVFFVFQENRGFHFRPMSAVRGMGCFLRLGHPKNGKQKAGETEGTEWMHMFGMVRVPQVICSESSQNDRTKQQGDGRGNGQFL